MEWNVNRLNDLLKEFRSKKNDMLDFAVDRLVCQDVGPERMGIQHVMNGGFNILVDGEVVYKCYVAGGTRVGDNLGWVNYKFEELWYEPFDNLNL